MKLRLLFVSTCFLFPVDTGGRVRTTQILRGMRGGEFDVTLVSPATRRQLALHADEVRALCDRFVHWNVSPRGPFFHLARMRHLRESIPIPVKTDSSPQGEEVVVQELSKKPDVAVFDFLHSAILAPSRIDVPAVLFTHNVEAEIFDRHFAVASNPAMRWIWRNQARKMATFEAAALPRFDVVVAVSDRDASKFATDYGIGDVAVIPTGVDLDYYDVGDPVRKNEVVFCGSMDWHPNRDAIGYFLESIWPQVAERAPSAQFVVVGRNPPRGLIAKARAFGARVRFTGWVPDVREHVRGAAVSVIPMRVGGGTRLKVYEAMALGSPIVSTTLGVEGLPVADLEHYRCADTADAFADAIVDLLRRPEEARRLARRARTLVEERFSHVAAAKVFERACLEAIARSYEAARRRSRVKAE